MNSALFVAWKSGEAEDGRWGPIGRLDHVDGVYRFVYTKGALSLKGFHAFPEMPRLDEVYESDALFPIFVNRLLGSSRPEFEAYLAWGGFDPAHPPDPIAILGVTEGRRATDALEVFPVPLPGADGSYTNTFFLHGVRWIPAIAQQRIAVLQPGETLGLMLDISNRHDSDAVAVRTCDVHERFLIGYVPRYLARDVRELCIKGEQASIELKVQRVNPAAPYQQRLLCRMNARWPRMFTPCTGEAFQPIAGELAAVA